MSAQLALTILLWQMTIARSDRIKHNANIGIHFGRTLANGIMERNETDESNTKLMCQLGVNVKTHR